MSGRLLDGHDALLLDLDGTVFRGGELVPGADRTVDAAREAGVPVRYTTNNASRSPEQVAAHLVDLGLRARADEVRTSAQAGASVLAGRLPAGAAVLVVGTDALVDEVRAAGLRPVRRHADGRSGVQDGQTPEAVVQGHSPDTGWRDLAEACLALRSGVLWVACNADLTLPTERGQLPGNGAMVAALRAATGREPVVAGKPERPLLDQAARSVDATRPLVVGDRLDTDIAGAVNAGMDSLLVMSGVTTAADALAAPEGHRPRYLGADLSAVLRPADDLRVAPGGGWRAEVRDGVLHLAGSGDPLAALRTLCAVWWEAGGGPVAVAAEGDSARSALADLDLASA
ncbi:Haloacid Dehalogenase Superfamily Class (subfamily) IIA [Streptoalloteichus tenebrarius]|uniref:Haloacid Dehalogenase Superfamily Class (Subfamily) IIA n=1 Tax=Streptoalloteichus tenebrarius (strain ATCC 17920 / DSM 40477 / JCM 4838 / CBS 697.72 / NBRC 16177 / NCIMB 11028 / NRRL B-12390 / A12253. 1 / ISP 5477) TaxID=1933 RepID=A0ABT1I0G2_STRSD|nr:HAD-IIA family hydrolase [Streptoalloteichus tenebrarius]MCP2261273.1 Haloacid Dehalogenase Superfamily Class (subfamily) IIA [Streptoalloteichus tenebrarius]BFF03670.1 HAD-IIA family hydrolase [Streptoalloteichus tenebrarius]